MYNSVPRPTENSSGDLIFACYVGPHSRFCRIAWCAITFVSRMYNLNELLLGSPHYILANAFTTGMDTYLNLNSSLFNWAVCMYFVSDFV